MLIVYFKGNALEHRYSLQCLVLPIGIHLGKQAYKMGHCFIFIRNHCFLLSNMLSVKSSNTGDGISQLGLNRKRKKLLF